MEKSKEKKLRISLRFFITLSVSIVCVAVICAFSLCATNMYYQNEITELKESIEKQCDVLEENISIYESISADSVHELKSDIESIATFFSGRVFVIGNDYKIDLDSAGLNEGAYIINEDVMSVMTGNSSEKINQSESYIQYIHPVEKNNEIKAVVIVNASLEKPKQSRKNALRSNHIIGIVIVFISIIVSCIIGYASTRGVKFINQHIAMAREGHGDEIIPEKGFEEFRALTENYNKNISKLMEIDSSRQEFVSNVSHELKTPITSMKVLADSLVENENADLNMYKEFMTDIVEEIDRESQIITDLLTLVKTDKSSSKMELSEVDINELIEIIIKRVTPLAQTRGIEISYESYREVKAKVDPVKLSLALSNIIENAVKYNIDNGWIKVTLNADHKNFHVKVADSGVGIPDDCKEKVFERFYRVDKARSRDTGGTGLGLAITRNIILLHKGTIKLYSESGAGTTFTIKIPINLEQDVDKKAKDENNSKQGKKDKQDKQTKKGKTNTDKDKEIGNEYKIKRKVRNRNIDKAKKAKGFILIFAVLSLSSLEGCMLKEKAIENETTEITTELTPETKENSVYIYYTDGTTVMKNEDMYQLKQPDMLASSIEEVIGAMSDDLEKWDFSVVTFMTDGDNNLHLVMKKPENINKEKMLLVKAGICNTLFQLSKLNDIELTINETSGEEYSHETFNRDSFYVYEGEE